MSSPFAPNAGCAWLLPLCSYSSRIQDHHFLPLHCLGRGCFQHFYSSSENDSKWSVIKKMLSFYNTSSLKKHPLLKVCALFQQFKALCLMLIHISKVTFKLKQTVSDGNGSFYKPSLKNVEDDTVTLTDRRSTLSLSRFPLQQPILFYKSADRNPVGEWGTKYATVWKVESRALRVVS